MAPRYSKTIRDPKSPYSLGGISEGLDPFRFFLCWLNHPRTVVTVTINKSVECLQTRNSLADFRGKELPDENPYRFRRIFTCKRKWEFRGDQEISGEMYRMYNEGCDQGDDCPIRDPLPTSACTSASVVSVFGSVFASIRRLLLCCGVLLAVSEA